MSHKNFRSQFLEKIGFKGVDTKKSIEILLAEAPLDRIKLCHFGLKYNIPAAYRIQLWKILLGISPLNPSATQFVSLQQAEAFQVALRSLAVLRLVEAVDVEASPASVNSLTIFRIFLLQEGHLNFNIERQCRSKSAQIFMKIADCVLNVSSDPVDAYLITRALFLRVSRMQQEGKLNSLVKCTASSVARALPELTALFGRIGFTLPLERWFSFLFSELFCEAATIRIWDRLICGNWAFLQNLTVSLLLTLEKQLLCVTSASAVQDALDNMSEDSQLTLLQRALQNAEDSNVNSSVTELFGVSDERFNTSRRNFVI